MDEGRVKLVNTTALGANNNDSKKGKVANEEDQHVPSSADVVMPMSVWRSLLCAMQKWHNRSSCWLE